MLFIVTVIELLPLFNIHSVTAFLSPPERFICIWSKLSLFISKEMQWAAMLRKIKSYGGCVGRLWQFLIVSFYKVSQVGIIILPLKKSFFFHPCIVLHIFLKSPIALPVTFVLFEFLLRVWINPAAVEVPIYHPGCSTWHLISSPLWAIICCS